MKISLCDVVKSEPCLKCGSFGWIIDGDMERYWLLCIGKNCIETKPLPEGMVVEDED